jgi:hypothetical protein
MTHKLSATKRIRKKAIYRLKIQHPNHIAIALKEKLAGQDISRFKAAFCCNRLSLGGCRSRLLANALTVEVRGAGLCLLVY